MKVGLNGGIFGYRRQQRKPVSAASSSVGLSGNDPLDDAPPETSLAHLSSLWSDGIGDAAVHRGGAWGGRVPFMRHIYAALAEKERVLIADRTRAALAQKKARGSPPCRRCPPVRP